MPSDLTRADNALLPIQALLDQLGRSLNAVGGRIGLTSLELQLSLPYKDGMRLAALSMYSVLSGPHRNPFWRLVLTPSVRVKHIAPDRTAEAEALSRKLSTDGMRFGVKHDELITYVEVSQRIEFGADTDLSAALENSFSTLLVEAACVADKFNY